MRLFFSACAHRPVTHPILGPTIHRPTHLIPTVFQTKRPIPLAALNVNQIKLPPRPSVAKTKAAETKTSIKLVRGILKSAERSSSNAGSRSQLWPPNLRVEDNWKGRGRWGEGRPDHLEWLGVQKKPKDLMISLRAER